MTTNRHWLDNRGFKVFDTDLARTKMLRRQKYRMRPYRYEEARKFWKPMLDELRELGLIE